MNTVRGQYHFQKLPYQNPNGKRFTAGWLSCDYPDHLPGAFYGTCKQKRAGISSNASNDLWFTPFFSTRKNGNGIGLSPCRQIMLLHQGTVRVHAAEGRGTSFHLVF